MVVVAGRARIKPSESKINTKYIHERSFGLGSEKWSSAKVAAAGEMKLVCRPQIARNYRSNATTLLKWPTHNRTGKLVGVSVCHHYTNTIRAIPLTRFRPDIVTMHTHTHTHMSTTHFVH